MDQHNSPAEAPSAVVGSSAVRRPPRVDSELRERPARGVLPGWVALVALLAAAVAAVLVQARQRSLPARLPGAARLDVALAGAPLSRELAGGLLTGCALVAVLAVFGLMANPVGRARVLTRWGGYRGTVRRTGLVWVNPLLKRRTVDVRVRHWRSEPIAATDREGSPLRAELLLVWAVRDTARARLSVPDHQAYLAAAAEAALCRVAATLPCDSFASPGPSLRDGQWLGGELTRLLAAEAAPVGVTVFSAQALTLDYTAEFAAAMRRRRLAELDAGTREVIVGDALETAALTVSQLEHTQGLSLPPEARAALLRDLVAGFLAPAATSPALPAASASAASAASVAAADAPSSTVVTPRNATSVNGATPA
ncbi:MULTISPECIES: SPFH domain-containing protein [Streptacidiphilus]|uniref:SPFH domain-containing protein n=1 Tax=Streptacidiphilus cavernicola TaxID=3342716 RepID=A0ABV6UFT8_9ACTN|nr:SPFH domain-containing protein [Streptacidiphilus jeojiense]